MTDQYRRAAQLERVNEAVSEWLAETSREAVAEQASQHLQDILQLETNAIYLLEDDGTLQPTSWTEDAEALLGELPTFEPADGIAWQVFETGEPAIYDNVTQAETVYNPATPIRSEIVLPLGDHGVALIGSEHEAAFDDEDVTLAKIVASNLAATFDRIRDERRLERERDLTDRILDAIPVGGIVLDTDGEVTRLNDRAAELFGVTDPASFALQDRPVYDETGDRLSPDEYPSERVLTTGDPEYERILRIERPEGDPRWLSVNTVPITDERGEIDRIVSAAEDVTAFKERERKLESELREVFGRVSDAFYAVDEDLRFTHVNDRAAELLGYDEDDLLGERIADLFPESDERRYIRERFETAMETQETIDLEHYSKILGVWIEATIYPSESGVSVYFRDITERKEIEQELRESEARFQTLAENVDEIVWMSTPDTKEMLYINPVYEDVWGRSRESLYDDPYSFLESVHPDDRDRVAEAYGSLPDSEYDEEFRVVRSDGSTRWVHAQGVPVRDEEDTPVRIVGIAADVTERRERERELREAKSQLEAATEAGAVGTWEWHVPEDRFVAGASFARTFDVDPEAAREGVSLERFVSSIHEADRDRVEDAIDEALETCGEYEAEYRVRNADGEWRWVVARGHVECDGDGNPITFPGALADITERKRAEQALEETKTQLETLIGVLPVGVVVAEADGSLVRANDVSKAIWGGNVFDADCIDDYEQFTGWWADTGTPVAPDEWTMARVLQGEEVTEPDVFEIEADGGERRTIAVRGMPVRNADGEVVRGVVTQSDITERREYRRRLETSERRHRTLVENFPDGAVALFDEDLEYTAVGGHYFDVVEADPDDRVGHHVSEVYPDDIVAEIEPAFHAALNGEESDFEVTYNDRHFRLHTVPVRDADGDIYAGMAVAQDVTERREYERKLEDSNERLEQFAYAVSHDLQEPLRMVSSYLSLLEDRYEDELDDDGREFIEFAVDGAERMRAMIDGLLEYSRVETRGDPLEPTDLNAVVDEVLDDLQFRIEETDADISVPELPHVEGDSNQLRQVFQNLLENAIEYSGDEPPSITLSVDQRSDDWVISVADEGIGIDPDDADRIFDVFERLHTQDEHAGTGIGLALCERIVDRHGGEIWVDSDPGEGSTFSFTLSDASNTE
uniref:PAS domain S-box protein n=1 Tax=Halopiger aswanensis TaxID=148449 RepID=UPI00374266E1